MKSLLLPSLALVLLCACQSARNASHPPGTAAGAMEQTCASGDTAERRQAVLAAEKAVSLKRKSPGPGQADLIEALRRLGEAYASAKDFAKAASAYGSCVLLLEQQPTPDHAALARVHEDLASAWAHQGNLNPALESYSLARAASLKSEPGGDVAAARVSVAMGRVYLLKWEYKKALAAVEQPSKLLRDKLGPRDMSAIDAARVLGDIHAMTRKPAQAEEQYNEALEGATQGAGESSLAVAMIRDRLGDLYRRQGKIAPALTMLGRSLEIKERILPPGDRELAITYGLLGNLYASQSNYAVAMPFFEKALPAYQCAFDEYDLEKASFYSMYATALYVTKNYTPAYRYSNAAFSVAAQVLGNEHPYTKSIGKDIDFILNSKKEPETAPATYNIPKKIDTLFPFGKALTHDDKYVSWTIVIDKISENEYEVRGTVSPYERSDVKDFGELRQKLLLFSDKKIVEEIFVKASVTTNHDIKIHAKFKTDTRFDQVFLKLSGTIYTKP